MSLASITAKGYIVRAENGTYERFHVCLSGVKPTQPGDSTNEREFTRTSGSAV